MRLLLAAAATGALAAFQTRQFFVGPTRIVEVYDDACVQSNWVFSVYNASTATAYFSGICPSGLVTEIICEPSQLTRILIASRGCDNADPTLALENSNCAQNVPDAYVNLQTMLREWALPWSPGTLYRFGPVVMLGMPPSATYSDANLLQAQGLALHAGMGPYCAVPTLVHIEVDLPPLMLNSTCEDTSGLIYEGFFAPDRQMYELNVQFKFDRTDLFTYQVFQLVRNSSNGILFNLELDDGLGAPWRGQDLFLDFVSIPQNTSFNLYKNESTCSMSFFIAPSDRALLPPEQLDGVNYAENKLPLPPILTSRVCNYCLGHLTAAGFWACAGTPEGQSGGGDALMCGPGPICIPVQYPANPTILTWSCDRTYPVSDIVPTLGGGTLARQVGNACFYPFLNLAAINASGSFEEKFRQCFMLGGWVSGASQVACVRDLGYVPCRDGWLYIDQHCLYKPDDYTDANMAVPLADAEAVCQSIGGTAAWNPTADVLLFIEWMTLYRPGNTSLRVTLPSGECQCFNWVNLNATNPTSPITVITGLCPCDLPAFSICSYFYYSQPLPYMEVSVSPPTRVRWREGQTGLPFRGEYMRCQCYDGFTGSDCGTQTCPNSACNSSSVLCAFTQACTINGNGACFNGQPRLCKCNPYFGPDASIDPSLPYYQNSQWPCACPATSSWAGPFYIINDVLYNDSAAHSQYSVCGTASKGKCVADINLNIGYCQCTTRPLFDQPVAVTQGAAFDGAACTCPVPIIPPLGYDANIVARFCNNKGTCCPAGERQNDEIVDGDPSGFIGRCNAGADGCDCDNGVTGLACTCPTNVDRASGLLPVETPFTYSIDLGQRYSILYVVVQHQTTFLPTTCTPEGVGVTDSLTLVPTACLQARDGRWNCPPPGPGYDGFGRFIVVDTAEQNPACSTAVFSTDDPPCGPHGNPFSGRFYAIEGKRSPVLYIDPQPIEFSPFGCTHSACMCNSNYTGPACRAAVSSYSVADDGRTYPIACGVTTFGSRGDATDDGACVCNPLSSSELYGLGDQVAAKFVRQACACAAFWLNGTYEECNGVGVCIDPSFSYGFCSVDLARIASDPLSTPFVVAPAASQVPSVFAFFSTANISAGGDPRSVAAINDQSWLLSDGTELTIPTLVDSFVLCSITKEFPVNVTFSCSDSLTNPVRAWAEQLVFGVSSNSTQWCDPAVVDTLSPLYCAVQQPCGSPPCIYQTTWFPLPNNTENLNTGSYVDVWFPCAVADIVQPQVLPSIIGVISCNNAVYRTIDMAAYIGYQQPLQCNGSITPYSNANGQFYGLFDDQEPGLPFVQGMTTLAHYEFAAQVINNQRWFTLADNASVNLLDPPMIGQYIISWINQSLNQEATTPVPMTSTVFDVTGGSWDFEGETGSFYANENYVLHGDTSAFVLVNRKGKSLAIPYSNNTRLFTVIAPFPLRGLQLVAEEGICATYLGPSVANQVINLPCVSSPLDLAQVLNITTAIDPAQGPAAAADFPSSYPFLLYYDADFDLNYTMVFVSGRPSSYSDIWSGLVNQIEVDRLLPFNFPLQQAYQSLNYIYSRPIDLNNTDDLQFVYNIWVNVLAARRCSDDWNCALANAGTCVRDSIGYIPWLNGDPAKPVGVTGNEGGCACPPNYEQQSFCTKCLAGLGPNYESEWILAQDYQQQLELQFPGLVEPIFNEQDANQFCRLPCYTTTRPTCICGGRGKATYSQVLVPLTVPIFPDVEGHWLTPACSSIVVNGSVTLTNQNDSIIVQSFDHVNGTRINVWEETVYVRSGLTYTAYELNSCATGVSPFQCSYTSTFDGTPLLIQCMNAAERFISNYGLRWVGDFQTTPFM